MARLNQKVKMNKFSFLFFVGSLCFASALPAEQPKSCSTEACKRAAQNLIDSMNATANPCEDFYEYACGGWKHRKMPDDKVTIASFELLNERMTKEVRELVEKFNIANESKTSASAVSFGVHIYQQCMALGKESNETGLAQLKDVVKSILGDQSWDIGRNTKDPEHHHWTDGIVKIMLGGSPGLFFLSFFPKNATSSVMAMVPAPFGLGQRSLQNLKANAKHVSAFKEYIRASGKLFCGDHCNTTLLESDIDDIVKLESELAMNRLSIEEQRDFELLLHTMTFKQLHEKTKIDWFKLVLAPTMKSLGISNQFTELSEIVVFDLNYTVKAMDILAKTSPRTLANYFGWRIVSNFGPYASEQLREIEFHFKRVIIGLQKLEDRKEKCYNLAYTNANVALSRLFVDHYFSEKDKKEATVLVDSIHVSLHTMLEQNQWLDPETKKASLDKLSHVTKNVGYPEWIRQNDQLDEYYLLQNKTEALELLANKNLFLSLAKFTAIQMKNQYLQFWKPYNLDKNWPMPPAMINAGYYYMQNSITIPAGILKSPSFDAERPFSLNYGEIGAIIGHEFTHGLDDVGRKFDAAGNLHNWWTPEALKQYKSRGECFVEQYSSQVEKVSGLHLNGINGLGENIADNGGLHISYHALQVRQAKTGRAETLADLPKLTTEQLYFLSYANFFCRLDRPEMMKLTVLYDAHPPHQYRVNIPVSNSPDFSKAYNCPVGSPMNPTHKCSMW